MQYQVISFRADPGFSTCTIWPAATWFGSKVRTCNVGVDCPQQPASRRFVRPAETFQSFESLMSVVSCGGVGAAMTRVGRPAGRPHARIHIPTEARRVLLGRNLIAGEDRTNEGAVHTQLARA